MTDYWAWRYVEDPKLMDAIEDEGFSEDDILQQWAADAENGGASSEQHNDPDDWEAL